jgi:hypothetical protein
MQLRSWNFNQRARGWNGSGADSEWACCVLQTYDGGFIVAGGTTSFGAGEWDVWVLKTDALGNISGDCPAGIGVEISLPALEINTSIGDVQGSSAPSDMVPAETGVHATGTASTTQTQCSR